LVPAVGVADLCGEALVKAEIQGDAQNTFAPVIDWLAFLPVLPLHGEDSPRAEI
jgi:hypothetical protein